ncbi:MAG: hypothetical protein VB934_00635, partial [Polyangiaceae bacterium]
MRTFRRGCERVLRAGIGPVVFLCAIMGCTSSETEILEAPAPEDSCIYARDGVCDEPRNCGLGTDSIDCDQACSENYHPGLAAACAYDEAVPQPSPEDPGSHGAGGPGGYWESSILARDPDDASASIPRYYRVYVPPSYQPAKPTPLLYVMGGFRVDNHSLAASDARLRDLLTLGGEAEGGLNAKADGRELRLPPGLQVGGGLDLDLHPICSLEIPCVPLRTRRRIYVEGSRNNVLSQNAARGVAGEVGSRPLPELEHREHSGPTGNVEA